MTPSATVFRRALRGVKTWAAGRTAVSLHAVLGDRPRDGFAALAYHRVAELSEGVAAPTWNVTPRQLRAQLEGLLSRGFVAWPLSKVLEACRETRPIPNDVLVVTFDDGYENNFLHALPILRELRVPATVFLATAFLDSDRPFPFDDWSAAGSASVPACCWRPLATDQCRQLLASGWVELGTHTHTHQRFAGDRHAFQRDLKASLDVLCDRFGASRPALAFPFGLANRELIDAAKETVVSCAFSTLPERNCGTADPFCWGRVSVAASDSASVLAAKLTGWYTVIAHPVRACQRMIPRVAARAGDRRESGPFPAGNEALRLLESRQP
jgi:peptidoglycan/xylan/chitin deacetylase (PgdA/CDA1 family)